MPSFIAFISFAILTSITPGPNNLMIMTNATKLGFMRGMPLILGVFAGFTTVIALGVVFSANLYNYIPSIAPYMKVVGCAYIFYLAWKTYKSTGSTDEGDSKLNNFFTGYILQFVNPKGVLYSISVAATFITPYYHDLMTLTLLVALLGVIGLFSMVSWALFGALFQKALVSHAKVINTTLALVLVYCGVSLFL